MEVERRYCVWIVLKFWVWGRWVSFQVLVLRLQLQNLSEQRFRQCENQEFDDVESNLVQTDLQVGNSRWRL